jgi:hypothetical protein
MTSSYGGTEIGRAIAAAVRARTIEHGRPTVIFLLTDGEAWDLDTVNRNIQQSMVTAKATESPLKFFCLGIGESPSKVWLRFSGSCNEHIYGCACHRL